MRGLASVSLQAHNRKGKGEKRWGSLEGGSEKGKDEAERGSGQREKERALGEIFPWLLQITPVSLLLNDKYPPHSEKVLQINGCLREISSLAQWSVHSGAVSRGIYYSVTVNQRTHTHYTASERGMCMYTAESFSALQYNGSSHGRWSQRRSGVEKRGRKSFLDEEDWWK